MHCGNVTASCEALSNSWCVSKVMRIVVTSMISIPVCAVLEFENSIFGVPPKLTSTYVYVMSCKALEGLNL